MAKQKGAFPITGKLDEVVFYKTSDEGYLVKTKGSISKERLKSAPEFEGSRRARKAMSRAAKGTKLLRQAMGSEALLSAESRMAGKMNGKMMQVLKADKSANRMDEKLIGRGDLKLLQGHAWNKFKPVKSALNAAYKVCIDRSLGEMEVLFESVHSTNDVKAVEGSTHFEIFAVGALVDFEGGYIQNEQASSGKLAINQTLRTISLKCHVAAHSTLPMVVGIGVVFYQESNGAAYRLKDGACFEIVGVEQGTAIRI